MMSLWKSISLLSTICWVKCRCGEELASGKPTQQSGMDWYFSPGGYFAGNSSFAVDGKPVAGPNQTCSVTSKSTAPWWMVDLEDVHLITDVAITPRTQSCIISNVTISVSLFWDASRNQAVNPHTCYSSSDKMTAGTRAVLLCVKQLIGRFVIIRKFTSRSMNLCMCEVEVYGSSMKRFFSFQSRFDKRSHSYRMYSLRVPSPVICAGHCLLNLDCTSFNYEEKDGICEIMADSLSDMGGDETIDPGWTRYTHQ